MVLAMALMGTTGCAVFMVGSAAGLGAGVVSYVGNELQVSREIGLDNAWEAANKAMKDMEYTIIPVKTRKDKTCGIIEGRNAKSQTVRMELIRRTDLITDIRIRVGVFATAANKAAGQLLYEKMNKHL